MAENMGKWPSGHGQLTQISLSDGRGGKTVTAAAQFGYDRHGFEGYLGNVGSISMPSTRITRLGWITRFTFPTGTGRWLGSFDSYKVKFHMNF